MELAPGPIQLRNSGVSRTFQTNNSQEGPTRDKLVNCNKDTDLENVDWMFGVPPLDVGDRPPRVPGDRGPTMDSRPQPPRQTSVRDRQSGLGLVDYYTSEFRENCLDSSEWTFGHVYGFRFNGNN